MDEISGKPTWYCWTNSYKSTFKRVSKLGHNSEMSDKEKIKIWTKILLEKSYNLPTITTSIERDAVNVRIGRQLIEKNNQNLDEIYSFQTIKSSIRRHLFSRGIWSPGYIRPSLLYVVGGHFERMVAVFCPYTVPSLASPYPANTPPP